MIDNEKRMYFDVSKPHKKGTLIYLWILIILSIFCLATYLFPFFSVVNSQTRQFILTISGFDVAFGKYNVYQSLRVNPNIYVMLGYILGILGLFYLLIFTIWFSFAKRYNRIMFFIFSLTTPSFACLTASLFFISQLYSLNNLTGFADMIYMHHWYYITLSISGLLFLTTFITLIIIALEGDKTPIYIHTDKVQSCK